MANNMNNPIRMFTGPMFSGKTSSMFAVLQRIADIGITTGTNLKSVVVRPDIDSRDVSELSHSGVIDLENRRGFDIVKVKNLADFNQLDLYDCIGIDEAQFFGDLDECLKWHDMGKDILISCLDSDFNRKMFPPIIKMIPHCDITKLKSACPVCISDGSTDYYTAIYTKRMVTGDELILIGGNDSYSPRCRKHF